VRRKGLFHCSMPSLLSRMREIREKILLAEGLLAGRVQPQAFDSLIPLVVPGSLLDSLPSRSLKSDLVELRWIAAEDDHGEAFSEPEK